MLYYIILYCVALYYIILYYIIYYSILYYIILHYIILSIYIYMLRHAAESALRIVHSFPARTRGLPSTIVFRGAWWFGLVLSASSFRLIRHTLTNNNISAPFRDLASLHAMACREHWYGVASSESIGLLATDFAFANTRCLERTFVALR